MDISKESIPLKETKHSEKKREIDNNLAESRRKLMEKKKKEQEEKIEKREEKIEEAAGKLKDRKREKRVKRKEKIERIVEGTKVFLIEELTDIFLKSIPLKSETKEKFSERIKSNGRYFFGKMFEENLISLDTFSESESVLMKDLYRNAQSYSMEFEDNELNLDEELIFFREDSGAEDVKENLSDYVKDKVVDVISKEKELAEKTEDEQEEIDDEIEKSDHEVEGENEEMEKETEIEEELDESSGRDYDYRPKEKPSLFRSIMLNVSREPVSENGNKTNKIDMDMIMEESKIQYTLYEMLNTTKLVDFDSRKAQGLASNYFFEE